MKKNLKKIKYKKIKKNFFYKNNIFFKIVGNKQKDVFIIACSLCTYKIIKIMLFKS